MVRYTLTIADYLANLKANPPRTADEVDDAAAWLIPALDHYRRERGNSTRQLGRQQLLDRALDDLEAVAVVLLRWCAIHQAAIGDRVDLPAQNEHKLQRHADHTYDCSRRLLDSIFTLHVVSCLPARSDLEVRVGLGGPIR